MAARWHRFAVGSSVSTAIDLGILVALRQYVGLPLVVADAVAIGVASAVSYLVHRGTTFRHDPYVRWVRYPAAFVVVALVAGLVDVVALRALFAATGFTTTAGLLAAKFGSLGVAAVIRAVGYRFVLHEAVTDNRVARPRPLPDAQVRLSVVVPAYREADRIGDTVTRLRSELGEVAAAGGLEVIVVDDGSGDGTDRAALAAGADQVVTLPHNQGKGAAVRAGVAASRGQVVTFTDADLAYGPEHLATIVERIEAGWDVAIGNRRHPDSEVERASGLRALGSRFVNLLSAAVLLAAPRDTQCGLKGLRGDVARALFPSVRIDGFAFDIELLHLIERAELSLTEIPVHLDETGAPSTVRVLVDVVRLGRDLARIRWWASAGSYDDVRAALPVSSG